MGFLIMSSTRQSVKFPGRRIWGLSALIMSISACSLDSIVKVSDSETGREIDRDVIKSRSGAIGLYHSSLGALTYAFSGVSYSVAVMTDELQVYYSPQQGRAGEETVSLDSRTESRHQQVGLNRLLLGIDAYRNLHSARVQASQARQLLNAYGLSGDSTYIAGAYAIEGFAVMQLAEVMCSGVPLTQMPYEANVEYSEAVSTADMFRTAVALFDSALAVEQDSIPFLTLARIGKARAHLGLGEFEEAGNAAGEVEPGQMFRLRYTGAIKPGTEAADVFWTLPGGSRIDYLVLGNAEGGNGLNWLSTPLSQQDIRVPIDTTIPNRIRPRKSGTTNVDIEVANWVTAQLIQAEALLNEPTPTPDWILPLNTARSTRNLPPLADPVTHQARVDLLFRERALWLYLTGTRLGDYRRLVRHYGRSAYNVYPAGSYNRSADIFIYGDAFVFSPPEEEVIRNHRYDGCLNKLP